MDCRSKSLLSLLLLGLFSCSNSGKTGGGGGTKKPDETTTTTNTPEVGKVEDSAGFFVEITGDGKSLFNIHKGKDTFDEPCKINLGEIVDCYVDAEEMTFFAHDFALHYHVPSTMCSYVGIDPFYFINHETKFQTTSLNVFIGSNGAIGVDSNTDGVIDSSLGCYTSEGQATCCVGSYVENRYIWNAESGAYDTPTSNKVTRTLGSCIGGPATKSQPTSALGKPLGTFKWVNGKGISEEYKIESPSKHRVDNAWITNYFNTADNAGSLPVAFYNDIDPTAGTNYLGHPYYTIACLDSADEVLAMVNIQLREWNTKAAYDARKTTPTNHDESGFEATPFGVFPKNDYVDWLDIVNSSFDYPGFEYK